MKNNGIIAIVGRPNVGKSTIFNRIAGQRVSIVEDLPGVTRDRIYTTGDWLGRHFQLIDTGGIELADQPFQEEIRAQVQIAIDEADVILMICDGKHGLNDDDKYIAGILQRSNKPVVLGVNMIDDDSRLVNIYEFYALGLGDPIAVSGAHGIGIGDILDACLNKMPDENAKDVDEGVHIAVIGEPNVGKSSLVNAILNEERSIVSDIQGTTRDAIDTPFKHVVIDDIRKVIGREAIALDQDLFIQSFILNGNVSKDFIIERSCAGRRNCLTDDKLITLGNSCLTLFFGH